MIPSVRIAKRILDLAVGGAALVAAAPVAGVIAAAIRASSRGPVFYRQRRAGMLSGAGDGSFGEFWVYKFRTMVVDAEAKSGATLAKQGDPRITSVGRVLRKTRLDELPQLYNVLRGDMSLVGPRPERPELLRNLALTIPFFEERMRGVKPGLTGLAQVSLSYSGRLAQDSELAELKRTLINPFEIDGIDDSVADDMRTKMLYDFAYSVVLEDFWEFVRTDLRIIVMTPLVMFWHRTGR
ncbi:MAG: sugar transferase [Deltaproteobacteria bacterium]|nr:sugar transferase [Deltaproteobacteria bacterium]